jgi:hypothetical protein
MFVSNGSVIRALLESINDSIKSAAIRGCNKALEYGAA